MNKRVSNTDVGNVHRRIKRALWQIHWWGWWKEEVNSITSVIIDNYEITIRQENWIIDWKIIMVWLQHQKFRNNAGKIIKNMTQANKISV